MKKLYSCVSSSLEQQETTKTRYELILRGLVQYQEEFPFYFKENVFHMYTFPKPRLKGKKYMILTSCNTPSPFSWIFGQSRGAIRNIDQFFKTAGMKSMGKIVCTNAVNRKELPKPLIQKIERLLW